MNKILLEILTIIYIIWSIQCLFWLWDDYGKRQTIPYYTYRLSMEEGRTRVLFINSTILWVIVTLCIIVSKFF